MSGKQELFVEQISEFCSIVDRGEVCLVGIGVPLSFESFGYPNTETHEGATINDAFVAEKYIKDGTIALLAGALGMKLEECEIISARYDVRGDGNYKVIVGLAVKNFENLPEFLPEYTTQLRIPAGRYARMEINIHGREERAGYGERMCADEYFIGGFREDSGYVYDLAGYPMNTWDASGDIMAKYEPIRKPADENDRFDTIRFQPVLLPAMQIACCARPHGAEEGLCLPDFFERVPELYKTGAARYYQNGDFYGFPQDCDCDGGYKSCFGARVSSFDGVPECFERVTLPGGTYIHVTQIEFNGDNPSVPYEVAFDHLDRLYLEAHPQWEFDDTRRVIARFRQANCASVFVPVREKQFS